jgi:hypothetical protein
MMRWLTCFALIAAGCSSGGGFIPRRDGGLPDFAGPHDMLGGGDMARSASCSNGTQDGTETDIDCGGPSCDRCADNHKCLGPSDCQSNNCVEGLCAPINNQSCADGVRDGSETDVDCGGGSCPQCGNGRSCFQPSDCQSNNCQNGFCSQGATCFDGVKNGNESDVDCGGGACPACSNGLACFNSNDCQSLTCSNGLCCGSGTLNCDGQSFNGCEVFPQSDSSNCGSCFNACAFNQTCQNGGCVGGGTMLVGQFDVNSGPAWGGNPPCYTCQEACANLFGGTAGSYSCSTVQGQVNHLAWASGYGDSTHCGGGTPVADTYKLGTNYDCGANNCSYSAYVQDNCTAGNSVNYCYR